MRKRKGNTEHMAPRQNPGKRFAGNGRGCFAGTDMAGFLGTGRLMCRKQAGLFDWNGYGTARQNQAEKRCQNCCGEGRTYGKGKGTGEGICFGPAV